MCKSSLFEKIGEEVDVLRCPKLCGFDHVNIGDIALFDQPKGVLIYGDCGHCHANGVWKMYAVKGKTEIVLLGSAGA